MWFRHGLAAIAVQYLAAAGATSIDGHPKRDVRNTISSRFLNTTIIPEATPSVNKISATTPVGTPKAITTSALGTTPGSLNKTDILSSAKLSSEELTTSTIFETQVFTVTSCAPEVTNCPNRPYVTTSVIAVSTTVCPVSKLSTSSAAGQVTSSKSSATEAPSSAKTSVKTPAAVSSAIGQTGSAAVSTKTPVASAPAAGRVTNGTLATPNAAKATPSTVQMTTSTIFETQVFTVTSCAPEVTNCPDRLHVTTQIVAISTTVCPVSELAVSSGIAKTPGAIKSGASSSTVNNSSALPISGTLSTINSVALTSSAKSSVTKASVATNGTATSSSGRNATSLVASSTLTVVTTAITPSVILSTGVSGATVATSSGFFTNSSIPVAKSGAGATAISSTATAKAAAGTTEAPLVVTQTVTRGGSVVTETATVTATIAQPQIIIIRQITIFIFKSALGGTCPVVRPNAGGGFNVGGQTFPEIGEACKNACFTQFRTCTAASGKNFRVQDCQTQLDACMKAAANQTLTAEQTITQTVFLPPDATTGVKSQLTNSGDVVISTKTLTGGEVATVGTGGISLVTVTATATGVQATSAADAVASSIAKSVSQTIATSAITVTTVNSAGSPIVSVVTMTLTVPVSEASRALGQVTTTVKAGETAVKSASITAGGQIVAKETTSLITMTLPPAKGTGTPQITVITMTLTAPGSSGTGTAVIPSSTSTAVQTTVTSKGTQSAEVVTTGKLTSVVTMTLPPSGTNSVPRVSVVTMTISAPQQTTSAAQPIVETVSVNGKVSTEVVTVTMGDVTGVITMTMTAPAVAKTITVGGCNGGPCEGTTTITQFASVNTVTQTVLASGGACPLACDQCTVAGTTLATQARQTAAPPVKPRQMRRVRRLNSFGW